MDRRNKIPWWQLAACATTDPDLFVPDQGTPNTAAKKICAGCPVIEACLEDALLSNARGIRGGLSVRERKALKRRAAA